MDKDTIKKAKELETQIEFCEAARRYTKNATDPFFDGDSSLGFYIKYLCKDKTFYESLNKLLNDTEKRLQHKFDIL